MLHSRSLPLKPPSDRLPPWQRVSAHAQEQTQSFVEEAGNRWSHRFTLIAMFIYLGKIANIFPILNVLMLGKILIGLAVVAFMFEGAGRSRATGLFNDQIWRPFLALVIWALLTFPLGVWPGNSFQFITQSFSKEVVFILLLILTTRNAGDVKRIIWTYALNALLLDFALIKMGIVDVDHISVGRNEIAMTSVIAIGMLWPVPTGAFMRLVKLAFIAMMGGAILYSGSRGGYLGIAGISATFLYFRAGGKVAFTAVGVLAIGALVYIQLPSYVKGRVETIINYEQDYNLTAKDGRIAIWKTGMGIIARNPIAGVGISNFPIADGMANAPGVPWMNAHNAAIQVAAETGLLGLALFITILVRLFRTSTALRVQGASEETRLLGRALLFGWLGYVICGFFLSQGFTPLFYILVAMVVAAHRVLPCAGEVNEKDNRLGNVVHRTHQKSGRGYPGSTVPHV